MMTANLRYRLAAMNEVLVVGYQEWSDETGPIVAAARKVGMLLLVNKKRADKTDVMTIDEVFWSLSIRIPAYRWRTRRRMRYHQDKIAQQSP
jgi:hypothetical protein